MLITYGNGSWSVGSAHYADDIQNLTAFDVYILEYPGYADRPGSPSQTTIYRAADEAFQSLDHSKPTYLVGESLGSGVASYLAGTHPGQIAGVLLLSPFDRLTNVAAEHMWFLPVRLLLLDRFPSEDYLYDYHGPLGIMVDEGAMSDPIVPAKFGVNLYEGYSGPKTALDVPGRRPYYHYGTVVKVLARSAGVLADKARQPQLRGKNGEQPGLILGTEDIGAAKSS